MATSSFNHRAVWARARGSFVRLATGGNWAITQPEATRRNLIWFWCDGLFASASDNIVGTYLVIYLLALGASQAQIGLMSSLQSLSAAIMLLPGAMLVERIGRRRNLVLLGGGWARAALLILALLPFLIKTPALIFVAIAFTISRDALANLSFPAWMSLTGDIVPMEGRGRFFASRNFIMGLAGMTVTLLAGLLISHSAHPAGYQIALGAAFVIGLLSIFSFGHLTDRPQPLAYPQVKQPLALRSLLRDASTHREFMIFAATTALWNFSINIAGPFFSVYMVKDLHADATMIGLTSVATSVATMLVQRKLGELNDRWGARRLTMLSGFLIPIVPILWIFINAPAWVIMINLISGALWGAYNLASFNYLLMIIPADLRARYSALFQIIVTLSLSVGAAVGSVIITHLGYHAVFLGSGVGRFIAALLFATLLARANRAPRPAQA